MMRVQQAPQKLLFLILLCLVLFLNACQKSEIQYGKQLVDNGITNIILVDSMQPVISTVFKDSIITNQTQTSLLGTYTDPYFGSISSSTFMQIAPANNTLPVLLPNATYDSMRILLTSNKTFYGDTTQPAQYSAYRVTSEITLQDQVSFFNTSSFPVNSTALGTGTSTIRPAFADTARIKLDDNFGKLILGMIKRKSDTLKNNTVFLNYFKGLQITAQNGAAIYGFKDSLIMRMYYHETDLNLNNKYFDFVLNGRNLQFNHISMDRSASPLAALNHNNKEIPSTQTNHLGFSQSATGIYLKIAFPNIKQLLQRPDYVELIKAELTIKPITGSYIQTKYPLPGQLVAAVTDALNEPGGPLVVGSGSSVVTQTGNFFYDPIVAGNTNYSYDVTNYLAQQMTLANLNQNGLLIVPQNGSRSNNFNRLIIGDSKYPDLQNRIQLKIYYISVIH